MRKLGTILLLSCACLLGAVVFVVWQWTRPVPPIRIRTTAGATANIAMPVASKESPVDQNDTVEPTPQAVRVTMSGDLVNEFPASVTVHTGQHQSNLALTGMFTRVTKIFFISFNIYSIASYVETPRQGDTEALLDDMLVDGTRRAYLLRILKPLPAKAITKAMKEEIDFSFGDVARESLEEPIGRFTGQFSNGAQTGDVVYMVWLPGGRLYSGFDTPDDVGLVGEDVVLARAIWRIWAGELAGPERVGLVERYATDRTAETAPGDQDESEAAIQITMPDQ